ncbi:MAG: hypothetical protein HYY21_11080 [Candidatus Tectomicrobia bacterium]|nr:hypothetical protein [Candidatus Tectomicrobia bacterium]
MLTLLDMMEGARNCVRGFACVKPGERVVLWTDRSGQAHPQVVEALGVAVEEAGAEAVLLSSRSVVHRLKEPLQKPVLAAIREADVLLSLQRLENAATLHNDDVADIIFYTPTRNVAVISLTPELLASDWARFPAELLFTIYKKVRRQALSSGTDVFRLTDAHGSDLTGRIGYRSGFKYVDPPKQWQFFPGGEMAELPDPPVHGTLVFEQLEGFEGFLKEPIRLTVEDQWVTRVEGGEEARWFEAQMKRYENGNFFCELAIGVNPKAPVSIGLRTRGMDTIAHRHSGTFHCAVGKWANPDVQVKSRWHWDGGGLRPTLTMGEVELIREGRLTALDDPEIRGFASRYGHPDDVLAEVW